jgi:hypothetical protein
MPGSNRFICESLADDLLDGAEAISEFTGWPVRRVFYLLEKRLIPARKVGNRWTGLRSRIRRYIEEEGEGENDADGDHRDPAADRSAKLNWKSKTR